MSTLFVLSAAIALRNPFWPIGYDGEREVISAEPRVAVKVASTNEVETTAADAAASFARSLALPVSLKMYQASTAPSRRQMIFSDLFM